ncbi:hypothetical protein K402DRAFT_423857 [Aulographum hederae CBS 113979]|uniref:Inhibitor I9 domain-containing protein n=1 Tax=Aulographum hederae CBS 113979 TaxID=1176131 RepID=A0A6G1GR53_9PEZI|nr:hypothetical protein K402DRAFT_423857 [Aulographum hederae CBS 113979]
MKITIFTFLFSLLPALAIAAEMKDVIISFPANTPATIVSNAEQIVEALGGQVTTEYTIIPGFAATAPQNALDLVTMMGHISAFDAIIEEDGVVTIDGGVQA